MAKKKDKKKSDKDKSGKEKNKPMKTLKKGLKEMEETFNSEMEVAKKEFDAFKGGSNAAGTRMRKALMNIQKIQTKALRDASLDIAKSRKKEK